MDFLKAFAWIFLGNCLGFIWDFVQMSLAFCGLSVGPACNSLDSKWFVVGICMRNLLCGFPSNLVWASLGFLYRYPGVRVLISCGCCIIHSDLFGLLSGLPWDSHKFHANVLLIVFGVCI